MVHQLVSKGDLLGAINWLAKNGGNETTCTLLSARFHSLRRKKTTGCLSYENEKIEEAQIRQAILSQVKGMTYSDSPNKEDEEGDLLEIITNNHRRRPDIEKKAKEILANLREWKDERQKRASFDPSNRRFKNIKANIEALQKQLDKENIDSAEEFIEKINSFLEESIPTWKNLTNAYTLSCARGFQNDWIAIQLRSQPDDDEVKIVIAERIEKFIATIK